MLRLSLQRRRKLLPWLFLGPGLEWLIVFFAIPLVNQLNVSLQTGDPETGYVFTWAFSNYTDAISEYDTQFLRSIGYAATATVLCFVIAFPLAYFIAFKAGRWKSLMLLLIILPFFVSYVLRTVSWQLILSDNGFVVDTLKSIGVVGEDGRLLATRTAVIAGITYNFLPFMILPLYASLERIDPRMLEAGYDLYGTRRAVFTRVTLPLAAPGVVAAQEPRPGTRREHHLGQIFDEFRRFDQPGGGGERGLGLGLSICQRIARTLEHPLLMVIRRGLGDAQGTKFTFFLFA